MTLAVTIHSYQRPDGQTPRLLLRALQSVANQTYQDFVIYLVGDHYENYAEFESIAHSILSIQNRIAVCNLAEAVERDKYLNINNIALWNCGGANALNFANELARRYGFSKVCHLDHDDVWLPNHLELIAKTIREKNSPAFIHTLSQYLHHPVFPSFEPNGEIIEHYPSYCNLVHSSIYMDLDQLPLKYRDLWSEENRYFPSDGDMWERVREKCTAENLKCYIIKAVTCIHEQENY